MNEIILDIFPFINIKFLFIKDRLKMLHNYRGTDYEKQCSLQREKKNNETKQTVEHNKVLFKPKCI